MSAASHLVAKYFPNYGDNNVKQLYLFAIFSNGWFQLGNWLLFVLLFMTIPRFAMFEAIAFGVGLLLEMPSGAFADRLGRRRAVVIGATLQALGACIFIFGFMHQLYFFVGNLMLVGSFAFISGSLEALIYDSLKQRRKEASFDDVMGKSRSLGVGAMVLAGAIGGIFWSFNIYLPLLFTALSFTLAIIAALRLTEPKLDSEEDSIATFLAQIKRGGHYLFNTKIRGYTISFFMILASFTMWSEGFIRLVMATSYGFDGVSGSYLISFTLILGLLVTYQFSWIRRRLGDLMGFSAVLGLAAAAWTISAYSQHSIVVGVFIFAIISVTGSLAQVWTSVTLNKHIKSQDRATALSALSFIVQIPYVVMLLGVSDLNSLGQQRVLYMGIGVSILIGLMVFYKTERSNIFVKK